MTNIEDSQAPNDFFSQTLSVFNELSERFMSESPDALLQKLPQQVCELLSVPICIIWRKEADTTKLKVFSTYGEVDDDYKNIELDLGHPSVNSVVTRNDVLFIANLEKANFRLAEIDQLIKRRWISALSVPIKKQEETIGILDVFTKEIRNFNQQEKNALKSLANYAALSSHKIDLLKEKDKVEHDRNQLQELTDIMIEMTEASETGQVWGVLKQGVVKLVGDEPRIWIGRLNHVTGELEPVEPSDTEKVKFGKGIISQAIRQEKPIIAKDVFSREWSGIYKRKWLDTRSEMSIPIFIDRVPIRQNLDVTWGSKWIGIVNVESPKINDFPDIYRERLLLLARHAAIRLERLEFYRKFVALRKIEKEITKAQNYDEILNIVIRGITEILGFTWVNISMIDSERTIIKSAYIYGLSKEQEKEFKQRAIHSLRSPDIQAEIVRDKQIKVPNNDDPALDQKIFKGFEHEKLIRVFIPMVEPSSNLVIGTVEAGYQREYRQYIYEQDVQMLRSFVDDAVHALERRKSGLIDRITHELKSPVVGIRSHATFLQTWFSDVRLSPNSIAIKLEDILTDCDLLLYQIRQIEYFLGRSASGKPKFELVFVFRDIVIKTINQIKPILDEYDFSRRGIEYRAGSTARTAIWTDKIMLNQVIYNLLINAIKYSEKDPKKFRILVEATEDKESLTIKVKDWGIGIKEEDRNKIFQEGFRAADAMRKVGGSGLGLSISSSIMRHLGGSLKLVNNAKPTEFQIMLPKLSKEAANDSLRG